MFIAEKVTPVITPGALLVTSGILAGAAVASGFPGLIAGVGLVMGILLATAKRRLLLLSFLVVFLTPLTAELEIFRFNVGFMGITPDRILLLTASALLLMEGRLAVNRVLVISLLPVLLGVFSGLISAYNAVDPLLALKTTTELWLRNTLLFLVSFSVVRQDPTMTGWLRGALLSSGVFVAGIGILEVSITSSLYSFGGVSRASSTLINPNSLGAFLAAVSCLAIPWVNNQRSKTAWVLGMVSISAYLVALLATLSRGAWLGFIAGILYLIMNSKRRGVLILTVSVVLLVLLVTIGLPDMGLLGMRIAYTENAYSSELRLPLYQLSLRLFRSAPLTGIGAGNFEVFYSPLAVGWPLGVHNDYLRVAVETGIVGLSSLLLLFIMVFVYSRAVRSNEPTLGRDLLGLEAALTALMIHSLFDDLMVNPTITMIVWTFFGMVAGLRVHCHSRTAKAYTLSGMPAR